MDQKGDSTDKAESEGLGLVCDVMVDYLNQSRKPTRAKHTGVSLQRDGMSQNGGQGEKGGEEYKGNRD